jgi:N-acetylglucosaminyldiphosphoundecaprenol N-acetyl-beta-D-mannosaminyltransferase
MHANATTAFQIQDLPLTEQTLRDAVRQIVEWVSQAAPTNTPTPATRLIFTPNPEQCVQAQTSPDLQAAFTRADLLLPDGIGLVAAFRVLRPKWRGQRVTGVDVVQALVTDKSLPGPILVVGGRGYAGHSVCGRAIHCAEARAVSPDTIVWTEGYADAQHPSEQEEEELAAILRHVRPRIVFVALGAPLQEHWILEHEQLLHTHGVRVAMVVGGAFDMLLGLTPRAPLWMRRIGP